MGSKLSYVRMFRQRGEIIGDLGCEGIIICRFFQVVGLHSALFDLINTLIMSGLLANQVCTSGI